MKSPLQCFLPTVNCLPPYGNTLGKRTLTGAVAEWIPGLGGSRGMPDLGGPDFEFGLPIG